MRRQGVQLVCVCAIAVLIAGASAKRYTKIGTARIINGETITIDKVPYTVQLRDPSGFTFCAGTLLTPQHVVTAANCFPDGIFKPVTVVAGASSRSAAGVARGIAKLTIHPGFDKPTRLNNDVAVAKLDKPMSLGKNIQLVEGLCSAPVDGTALLQVSGWGSKGKKGQDTENLYTVRLPTLSYEECATKVGVTDSMLCTYGGKPDACENDAGGPGIFGGELCAIVSWGEFCGRANNPGVFTNVTAVRDFIVDNLKD